MEQKFFPLFISLRGKRILLIGAGVVALRRAEGLLRFGASLRVAAPEIRSEFYELRERYGEERLVIERRRFRKGETAGFDLVLAATGDAAAERQIFEECRERRIPVNIASDQTLCDFQFPALIEAGNIVVGVNSGGSDHRKVRRVSAKIREALAGEED